jgi:putative oxidoreductase
MNAVINKVNVWAELFARGMDWLAPGFLLGLRLYVAMVFFKSGLTKIMDFSSTVALFENEYKVPVLSPVLAAYAGTAAEFALPALFVLGLLSRPAALAFFVFNLVAVVSYPEISDAGVKDHMLWGTMMLVVLFFGPGRFALDHYFKTRGAAHGISPASSTAMQR